MNSAPLSNPPPAGWIDLSSEFKIRFTGADRTRYLNGQVTNDVAALRPPSSLHACVCDAKGRLQAEVWVAAPPDAASLLLTAPSGLTDSLLPRLERYIVSDDVALEDITDDWTLVHLLGSGAQSLTGSLPAGAWTVASNRFGAPGLDLWIPSRDAPNPDSLLSAAGFQPVAPTELARFRIARGIPLWDIDLEPGLLPAEARLDRSAVSFTKGCYIGQEIISRMRHAGKTNRLLCLLEGLDPGLPPAPGSELHPGGATGAAEPAGRPAGHITSAVPLTDSQTLDSASTAASGPGSGSWIALAFLRSAFSTAGTPLWVVDSENSLSTPCVVREYPDLA